MSCFSSAARCFVCTSPWYEPCCLSSPHVSAVVSPPAVLTDIHVQDDSKQQRSFGFVRFVDDVSVQYACRVLHGTMLFGKVCAPLWLSCVRAKITIG